MLMHLRTFKRLIKDGSPLPGQTVLRKPLFSTAEVLGERQVRYTISTGTVDRQNDTVSVTGWDLTAFLLNPVVLWGHDARSLPIGRCVDIANDGAALKAVVEYVPSDMPVVGELAEAVLRMSRTGFLSATSVGFRPLEYEFAKDRDDDDSWWAPLDFIRQELLEFSIVTIPANPEALIDPDERSELAAAGLAAAAIEAERAAQLALAAEQASQAAAVARRHRQALLRAYA